jgi:hypothetical protein
MHREQEAPEGLGLERRPAGEAVEEERAKRVDVRAGVESPSPRACSGAM